MDPALKQSAIEQPGMLVGLLEARAPLEGLSLLATWPWLALMPRGDGRPVVLAPGYGAGDGSMYPLYQFLDWLGYDAHHWGLGRNRGKVPHYIRELTERISELRSRRRGAPVTLIGWSLGGVVMREVARDRPDLVREVITLGTPVIGGPKYTRVGKFFAQRENIDLDELEREIHRRNLKPIECPLTCIYSKTDGIVAWRASIDSYNPHARNIHVPGSHLGLAFNPLVWRVIARTLARKSER